MQWRKLFIAFVAAAALLRLGLALTNGGIWWDEAVYAGLADGLRHGTYALPSGTEGDRPPLFPFLLALIGPNVLAGRLLVFVLSLAAVYVTYLLGRELYGRDIALVAAVILSSYDLFVFFTTKMLGEALFMFLISSSLLYFHRALKTNGTKQWAIAGALTGMALLARYPATVLFAACIAYALLRKRYTGAAYFAGAFLLVLAPWLVYSTLAYGVPWGAYSQNLLVFATATSDGWNYFITNYFHVFGPLGAFFVLASVLALSRKKYDFMMLFALALFVVFSLPAHKELRYLVAFFPLYALVSASAIGYVPKRERNGFLFAALAVSALSLWMGAAATIQDADAASALVDASKFLKDKEGAVLTELYDSSYHQSLGSNNPWLEVLGQKEVYVFPENEGDVQRFINEHPNVRYAVIYAFGPRVPSYAAAHAAQHWTRLAAFEQWGNADAAIVYEIPKVLVSITFDDGLSSQYTAAALLEQYGFRGTFYVPSGLLGFSFEGIPTMAPAQVQELHVRDHEIAGHTYVHTNANSMEAAAFENELLKDISATEALGITTTSFAYPYGEVAHEDIIAKYYTSGRNVIDRINPLPVPKELRYKLYAIPLTHENYLQITERLDMLRGNGGWLILAIHN
ncbi:MAG: glycosyltransferase family 39 protein, partial [Candidatus Aenigmarchaeota archaeon]|nr:glycosyltransferase family 39 protein [Candidatus Aenigmarchaeota archaeon]